jgi:predicted deacylase
MASFQPHPIELEQPDISRWREGNAGHYVNEFSASGSGLGAGPDVLITSLVHGNEYSGAIALHELLDHLKSGRLALQRGRVTAIFANVDGFESFDPADPDASRFMDQDFNRVWSGALLDGAQRSSELTRARAIRPLVDRATHLLDLHSMHEPCEPLLITGMLPRNVQFAQSLGSARQVVMDAGHKEGVRMRDYNDFGQEGNPKIALLLEAGQHWQASSVVVSRDVALRFLLNAGVVTRQEVMAAGMQSWLAADRPSPMPVEVTHAVVARSMAFEFTQNFTGNEQIAKAGTVIATDDGVAVTTPYDDCVLVMPSVRQLRPGVTTVRLGRRVAV